MQNSRLYRWGVVLPLDDEAERQLRDCDVNQQTAVRFLPIDDNELFVQLWGLGLFGAINSACSARIDEYEEEIIEPDRALAIVRVVDSLESKAGARATLFMAQLRDMAVESAKTSRPLAFVL